MLKSRNEPCVANVSTKKSYGLYRYDVPAANRASPAGMSNIRPCRLYSATSWSIFDDSCRSAASASSQSGDIWNCRHDRRPDVQVDRCLKSRAERIAGIDHSAPVVGLIGHETVALERAVTFHQRVDGSDTPRRVGFPRHLVAELPFEAGDDLIRRRQILGAP